MNTDKKTTFKFKHIDVDFDFNSEQIIQATLTKSQLESIARYMSYAIERTKKQLQRWENHPTDTGQVTYINKRQQLKVEIEIFEEIAAIKQHNKQTK